MKKPWVDWLINWGNKVENELNALNLQIIAILWLDREMPR